MPEFNNAVNKADGAKADADEISDNELVFTIIYPSPSIFTRARIMYMGCIG